MIAHVTLLLIATAFFLGARLQALEVNLSVDTATRSARVAIPEGAKWIRIEHLNSRKQWVRYDQPGQASWTFKVPGPLAKSRWRAVIGEATPGTASVARKYPASFYRGLRSFAPATSAEYDEGMDSGPQLSSGDFLMSGSVVQSAVSAVADSSSARSVGTMNVQEADIWKTEGHLVFFFNQLRGLQVIDVSNPAEPALVASLRMAHVGQDLYVLPSEGHGHDVVLLTRDNSDWTKTVVHLVKVADQKASIVASTSLPGFLSDSRLAGNRLFVATQSWENRWSLYETCFLREVVIDTAAGTLSQGTVEQITGSWPVISSGPGWMAVAASDWALGPASKLHLFGVGENGLERLNETPIDVEGRIYDKFKLQIANGFVSVISQAVQVTGGDAPWSWWGPPVTVLENFSFDGNRLARLEIIKNENLHATRFAGDKAYAVTFFQTDPLWVIDLSDPAAPAITGHAEIPGWSTYLEPIGDLLFSIGWDEGRIAAWLFDVSDPAAPTMTSRVFLTEQWSGSSESVWNEKALKVLPEERVALVPLKTFEGASQVRMLEIDLDTKVLHPRGTIAHSFEPRRSAMVDGHLVSISQKELVTADISDLDQPVILADLLLAWPADRVLGSGTHVLQLADGNDWSGESAAIRVSTAADTDGILEEVFLEGGGAIRDATIQDGKLHVLRAPGTTSSLWWRSSAATNGAPQLVWDVFDLSNLPSLSLLKSSTVSLDASYANHDTSKLVFPTASTACVLTRPRLSWWDDRWRPVPMPIVLDETPAVSALSRVAIPPPWSPKTPSKLPATAWIFSLSSPAVSLALSANHTACLESVSAADGIVVYGCGLRKSPKVSAHYLGLLNVSDASKPRALAPIDLPGRLRQVSDLSRTGFLAWTETLSRDVPALQVSACDLIDAYQIATFKAPELTSTAARGMSLYASLGRRLTRFTVAPNATPSISTVALNLDWTPYALGVSGSDLLAGSYQRILRVPLASFPAGGTEWDVQGINANIHRFFPVSNGGLLYAGGESGVERFDP